jgi:hypothetical protein
VTFVCKRILYRLLELICTDEIGQQQFDALSLRKRLVNLYAGFALIVWRVVRFGSISCSGIYPCYGRTSCRQISDQSEIHRKLQRRTEKLIPSVFAAAQPVVIYFVATVNLSPTNLRTGK